MVFNYSSHPFFAFNHINDLQRYQVQKRQAGCANLSCPRYVVHICARKKLHLARAKLMQIISCTFLDPSFGNSSTQQQQVRIHKIVIPNNKLGLLSKEPLCQQIKLAVAANPPTLLIYDHKNHTSIKPFLQQKRMSFQLGMEHQMTNPPLLCILGQEKKISKLSRLLAILGQQSIYRKTLEKPISVHSIRRGPDNSSKACGSHVSNHQ